MQHEPRCQGLEIRDGLQFHCHAPRSELFRYRRKSHNGVQFQIYLCPHHGEQFGHWGWKCVDTTLNEENDMEHNTKREIDAALEWLDIVASEEERRPLSHAGINAGRAAFHLRKYLKQQEESKSAVQGLDQIPHLQAYVAKLDVNNQPQFAARPVAHNNIGLAVKEAERLAKIEPGNKFAVFTALGYYQIPIAGPVWTGTTTRP